MQIPSAVQAIINQYYIYFLTFMHTKIGEYIKSRYSKHWLSRLEEVLDLSEIEKKCAGYHKGQGKGSAVDHPVPRLLRGLLLKYLLNLSYRQTEETIDCNIFFKLWVGYGLFDPPFDHVTLQRFETWVQQHHGRMIFDEILKQIRKVCEEDRQYVDTYAMVARAATSGLIELLRDMSERLLRSLEKVSGKLREEVEGQLKLEQLRKQDGEKLSGLLTKEEFAIRLNEVGGQVLKLVEIVTGLFNEGLLTEEEHGGVLEWLNYLKKVIADELEVKEDQIKELPLEKKGSYRIAGANDPEATLRNHGKNVANGYNVLISTNGKVVYEVQVETGSTPDNVALPKMLANLRYYQHGYVPKRLIGDRAFGTGKTQAEVSKVTDGQTEVWAYSPNYSDRSDRYSINDCEVIWLDDKPRVTCPNGKTTDRCYKHGSGDGYQCRFTVKDCEGCPKIKECRGVDGNPKGNRVFFLSYYRDHVEHAKERNKTPEFKKELRGRSVVERVIYNLTNIHGGRVAKAVGKAKAEFQARMVATAFNIRQFIRMQPAN